MKKTYFVTGGTGFIGACLARRLVESGVRVKCLARATSKRDGLTRLGVEIVEGDLNDLDALRRGIDDVDTVIHLAGLTRELRPGDFRKVNCAGAANVADVCAECGNKRLIVASSLAGAGVAPRTPNAIPEKEKAYAPCRLRRETDLPAPISPYGRSKRDAELELVRRADKVEISVFRPPYVFGEGDMASLLLFKMAKNDGNFVIPGYIDRFYSFVYVEDLVDIVLAIEDRGERLRADSLAPDEQNNNGKYGTCSGKGVYFSTCPVPIKFSEYGRLVGAAYGRKKVNTLKVPPLGVLGAGVYGEIFKFAKKKLAPLDWNKAIEALRGPWICSGEKVARLGVNVGDTLDEKIAATATWYQRQGLLD